MTPAPSSYHRQRAQRWLIASLVVAVAIVGAVDAVATTRPAPPSIAASAGIATASPQATPSARVDPTATPQPLPTAASTVAPTASPAEAARDLMRSVVFVQTQDAQGTGFLYRQRGQDSLVVTNAHVVGTAPTVTVITPDSVKHGGTVLARDEDVDVAVISILQASDVPEVRWGDAKALQTGEPLYVIGFALGSTFKGPPSVTRGIVSGRRTISDVPYIQTDAAINHGNSGGPVMNDRGEVVGIATWAYDAVEAQGISFAIPSTTAQAAAAGLLGPRAADPAWTAIPPIPGYQPRGNGTTVWTGSGLIVWGGSLEDRETNDGWRYESGTGHWSPVGMGGAPSPRSGQAAVWTGGSMLVWGGVSFDKKSTYLNDGASYDPATESWRPMPPSPLSPRANARAVWTGREMIVWGGSSVTDHKLTRLNDGARFNPTTGRWAMLPPDGAPSPRYGAAVAWAGQELIVWGGVTTADKKPAYLGDGARYDPDTNRWLPLPPGSPSPREDPTAVWTGRELIVWGGADAKGWLGDGARFDPSANTWRPMAAKDAPSARSLAAAVWATPATGGHGAMVLWGGDGDSGAGPGEGGASLADGARYDPVADSWAPLPQAAVASREGASAFWDGKRVTVWGGAHANRGSDIGSSTDQADGFAFEPPANARQPGTQQRQAAAAPGH